MEREDEIKLIAYNIWEEEGCLDGHHYEHWSRAEAIWEQARKDALKSTQKKATQPVKQNTRIMQPKKKSHKP
jgi:hypothetical protein